VVCCGPQVVVTHCCGWPSGDPAYDARAEPALGEPVLEQSQLAESPQTEQDLAIVS
jgi:hypothetical protein